MRKTAWTLPAPAPRLFGMNIGYIGLGNMGTPLARRIRLQHALAVYDMNRAAVQRMAVEGATACADARELASRCDVIFLCLPTSNEVRDVLFGPNSDGSGIAHVVKPGTLIVDQTTGDPVATRAMAGQLLARGIELIDAPVSGGRGGATAGTIAIMVGAPDAQFARIEPVLKAISPNIFHVGGTGAGHVMKLVNNMLSGTLRLLSFEGLALAVKNGIDPKVAMKTIAAGSGRNNYMEKVMPNVLDGRVGSGFTLGLIHKDVRLACQLGIDTGVPTFFGNLTRELYQVCINQNGADTQVNTAGLIVEHLAGTKFIPEKYSLD